MSLRDAISACLDKGKPTVLQLGHKRLVNIYSKCPCGSGIKFKWCCLQKGSGRPEEKWERAVFKRATQL